jgi:hypothetical protein
MKINIYTSIHQKLQGRPRHSLAWLESSQSREILTRVKPSQRFFCLVEPSQRNFFPGEAKPTIFLSGQAKPEKYLWLAEVCFRVPKTELYGIQWGPG